MNFKDFQHRIDIDAVEEALGITVEETRDDEDIAFCPLPWDMHTHGDTTGKFALHRKKMVWNCWVCGGGSLVSLVKAINDVDEEEAVRWLHEFAVDDDDDRYERRMLEELYSKEEEEETTLPVFSSRALQGYRNDRHEWIDGRGISPEIQERFKIMHGVEMKTDPKNPAFCFESEVIIFPHFWAGSLVGWQTRWLMEPRPKWLPKYTNTKQFPRKETLWGYDQAVAFVKENPDHQPIVVESVPSALFIWSNGFPAIATFGASVSEDQIGLLRKFQGGIVLAPDNDEAGWMSLEHIGKSLQRYAPVTWVEPPGEERGSDLGDLVEQPTSLAEYMEVNAWPFVSTNEPNDPVS